MNHTNAQRTGIGREVIEKLFRDFESQRIETVRSISQSFRLQDYDVLACMDERLRDEIDLSPRKDALAKLGKIYPNVRLAGSGTLIEPYLVENPKKAREIFRESLVGDGHRLIVISDHYGCGAAAVCKDRRGLEIDPADIAAEYSRSIELEFNAQYLSIGKDMMEGPDYHDAQIVYVVGPLHSNGSRLGFYARRGGLPRGFVITAGALKPDYLDWAAHDAELAFDIITGHHGLGLGGTGITTDNPVLYVVIGDPLDDNYSAQALIEKLEPRIRKPLNTQLARMVDVTAPDSIYR